MQSFYIHWPFCPYRCHFCPFVAYLENDAFFLPYHEALKKELLCYADQFGCSTLDSIYFGGGTPSTYPNALLLDTFGTLRKMSNFKSDIEITFEVNPGSLSRDQLLFWRELGINRLSIGVQSLNEQVLKKVNRLQTTQDVFDVLEAAQGIFDNISVDFILGLPEITPNEWKEQMQKVVKWPVKHLSIYFLMVHEFTPLYYKVLKNQMQLPLDDETADLYCWTVDFLAAHGFEQYEVSSFAKKGYQSKHNRSYWSRKPYRGFGVGAWSFDGTKRFRNKKNLMLYIKGINQGEGIIEFSDEINDEQATLEHIMLSLRQVAGLSCKEYFAHIPPEKHKQADELIAMLRSENLLKQEPDVIQLTPRGFAVEQEVIARLSL